MYHFRTLIIVALLSLPLTATAEILFEGIFSVEQDGIRTGYVIQRYEIDPAAKKRTVTTYQRTRVNSEGDEAIEAVRSVSTLDFKPIEFSRRSVSPGIEEVIKADFRNKSSIDVDAYFNKSKKIDRTDKHRVPKHSFLSAFLYYIVDIPKIPLGKAQSYVAFSEGEGRYHDGRLRVDGSKKSGDVTLYQLQDFFEGEDIESFVFPSGDPAGSRNANEKIVVYLAANREEAVNGFQFPQNELIELFGDLPEGQKNPSVAAGGKTNIKDLIKSFPVAKPTRDPDNVPDELNPNPDIKAPVAR